MAHYSGGDLLSEQADIRQSRKQPQKTVTRVGRLGQVFNTRNPSNFDFQVARLCVLVEDLRVEVNGLAMKTNPEMDEVGEVYRRMYFLRRSLGTLFEFGQTLDALNGSAEFQHLVRAKFHPRMGAAWDKAIRNFHKHSLAIERLRHNIGGHFGKGASKLAVKAFSDINISSLELQLLSKDRGGAIFTFAGEVVAAAIGECCSGSTSTAKLRRLGRIVISLNACAVSATYSITAVYLWDRFGK